MNQRLLVMNRHRLVQHEQHGRWEIDRVEKAGSLKPGIYNIYLATDAERTGIYDGIIVHSDKKHVYQQIGTEFFKHERQRFRTVPIIGENAIIKYMSSGSPVLISPKSSQNFSG
jgi:hypothetical protein